MLTSTWKKDSQGKNLIWRKLSKSNSQKESKIASEVQETYNHICYFITGRLHQTNQNWSKVRMAEGKKKNARNIERNKKA